MSKPSKNISDEKVKITALKTTLDEQLAREYGAEGLTACPMLKEGQVFYADYAKPEGFCDEAWKAIYQYAFALSHGAGKKYSIMETGIRKPGVAICSCNDGLRPVIFKLEATDEESEIELHACPLTKNQDVHLIL
ncbi:MAG: TIGR04076 family protein [Parabacteroides merdae]